MSQKVCEVCEATIGETDKTCPACGSDLELLPEEIASYERVNKVLENRKKKVVPPPAPAPQPQPAKKLTVFQRLALKKKGQ